MKKWFLFIGLALFVGAFVGCKKEDPTDVDIWVDIGLDNKSSLTWKVSIEDHSDIVLAPYNYKSIKSIKGIYHDWVAYVGIDYGQGLEWHAAKEGRIGFTEDMTLIMTDDDVYWE